MRIWQLFTVGEEFRPPRREFAASGRRRRLRRRRGAARRSVRRPRAGRRRRGRVGRTTAGRSASTARARRQSRRTSGPASPPVSSRRSTSSTSHSISTRASASCNPRVSASSSRTWLSNGLTGIRSPLPGACRPRDARRASTPAIRSTRQEGEAYSGLPEKGQCQSGQAGATAAALTGGAALPIVPLYPDRTRRRAVAGRKHL